MRTLFWQYHRPTDDELAKLWQECIFVFDANVLLDVYRLSPDARETFLNVLERLKDRSWLPYQAAAEFYENRDIVIGQQIQACDKALGELKVPDLGSHRRTPIDVDQIAAIFEAAVAKAGALVNRVKDEHLGLLSSDKLLERIASIYDGRVGDSYSRDRLAEIHKLAAERFKAMVPPGYEDAKEKPVPVCYGDVVLWFQMIDYAKEQKQPLVFVTGDEKDDWWLRKHGRTIGPRPELMREMRDQAGIACYVYQTKSFLERAQTLPDVPDQTAVIEEIEDIQRQNDQERETARIATVEDLLRGKPAEDLSPEDVERVAAARPWGLGAIDRVRDTFNRQQSLFDKISGIGSIENIPDRIWREEVQRQALLGGIPDRIWREEAQRQAMLGGIPNKFLREQAEWIARVGGVTSNTHDATSSEILGGLPPDDPSKHVSSENPGVGNKRDSAHASQEGHQAGATDTDTALPSSGGTPNEEQQ